jgi:hypothetical protein
METIKMTIVVQGTDLYVLDDSILDNNGNINITKVSGMSNLTFTRCDSVVTCANARKKISDVLVVVVPRANNRTNVPPINRTNIPVIPVHHTTVNILPVVTPIPISTPVVQPAVFADTKTTRNDSTMIFVTVFVLLAFLAICVIIFFYLRRNRYHDDNNENGQIRLRNKQTYSPVHEQTCVHHNTNPVNYHAGYPLGTKY